MSQCEGSSFRKMSDILNLPKAWFEGGSLAYHRLCAHYSRPHSHSFHRHRRLGRLRETPARHRGLVYGHTGCHRGHRGYGNAPAQGRDGLSWHLWRYLAE